MLRVLILGGTTEASALAGSLLGDRRYEATLSLAGRTRSPVLPAIGWRIGNWGFELARCDSQLSIASTNDCGVARSK